jgi:DNA repair exonuclease SbcCD ATPase subunit
MAGKPDRDWEHWPARRQPDDRRRFGLKALFSPTDQPQVEELIDERSRELELRTEQLHATIADLERREEQALRLRAAVEEMLRHGSAELDDRHAELTALAAELAGREERLEEAERELAERRRELGAVELLRAAVERREAAAAEREETLERIAADLAERERALADLERRVAALVAREAELDTRSSALETRSSELDTRSTELDAREDRLQSVAAETERARHAVSAAQAAVSSRETMVGDLEATRRELELEAELLARRSAQMVEEQTALESGRGELARAVAVVSSGLGLGTTTPAAPDPGTSHLLFVPGDRYRLEQLEGPAPGVSDDVVLDGALYRVVRVGRSPLPGDPRRCAYLEPSGPRSS